MRRRSDVVIRVDDPPTVPGRELARQNLHLRVLSRILVRVNVLDVERNLSSQLIRGKETLEQNESGRVVVAALHSHNVNHVLINLTHKVIDDDDGPAAVPIVLDEVDKLLGGRIPAHKLGHNASLFETLVDRLPGGVAEHNISYSSSILYHVLFRLENTASAERLSRTRRTNDEVRGSLDKPGIVLRPTLAKRTLSHDFSRRGEFTVEKRDAGKTNPK